MAPVTRLFTTIMAVLGLLLLGTGTAAAHANLVSSTPGAGTRLDAAPSAVTIVFSEELKPTGNRILVTDATGARIDNDDTTLVKSDAERKTISVTLTTGLANGIYRVAWENASTDGHSETGNFTFGVGVAAPAALPRTGDTSLVAGGLLLLASVLLASGAAIRRPRAA